MDSSTPRAVILDVDGTMYSQAPVRLGMLLRLSAHTLRRGREGLACIRALGAYRRAQEQLRDDPRTGDAGEHEQLVLAARLAGVDEASMRRHVERWMERAPLDLIARAARPGLRAFLEAARDGGSRIGAYSDYFANSKLAALGVQDMFDVVRSARGGGDGAFKPNPSGLIHVARELGVDPRAAVYVGDRVDVDAAAARRAGMRAFILSRRLRGGADEWVPVRGFAELTRVLYPRR